MERSIETYIERIVSDLDCSLKEKRDLAEELTGHLDMLVEEYENKGFDKEKASALAIKEFGDPEIIKEGLEHSVAPEKKVIHKIGMVLFGIYAAAVLGQLIVFRLMYLIFSNDPYNRYFSIPQGTSGFFNLKAWEWNTNIVPFHSIYTYITGAQNFNLNIVIDNTLGNILIFIPLGIFLMLLFRRFNTIGKVAMAAFVLTVSIEITQFFLRVGRFDVDDIILNTLGAVIGAVIYRIAFQTYRFAKTSLSQGISG
ncbi:VanZ family protein [Planococcus sp. CAU13]|uniref:VanZ family protein n=1 Tax=Planococcus sp. CAU13 TaxID=1541197 RepID=UPI00052FF1B0|nr:VanZ family protein [Planococcus sp. CAU13]